MAWRLANSLVTLKGEIDVVAPGTTFWTIGDAAHAASWSDHNPNAEGVVCAADILDDGGLWLWDFAETIVATNPPALKYVIYEDSIWFPGYGWDEYTGEFHTHVHVSVGWGPDGRSTGPYDDTSPWGLLAQEADLNDVEHDWLEDDVWGTTALRDGLAEFPNIDSVPAHLRGAKFWTVGELKRQSATLSAIKTKVDALATPTIDYAKLAAALAPLITVGPLAVELTGTAK